MESCEKDLIVVISATCQSHALRMGEWEWWRKGGGEEGEERKVEK